MTALATRQVFCFSSKLHRWLYFLVLSVLQMKVSLKKKNLLALGEKISRDNIFCNNFPVNDEHSFLFHRTAKQIAEVSRNLAELS